MMRPVKKISLRLQAMQAAVTDRSTSIAYQIWYTYSFPDCSQFTINTLAAQPIAPPSSTLSSSAGPSRSSEDATPASILLLDLT